MKEEKVMPYGIFTTTGLLRWLHQIVNTKTFSLNHSVCIVVEKGNNEWAIKNEPEVRSYNVTEMRGSSGEYEVGKTSIRSLIKILSPVSERPIVIGIKSDGFAIYELFV